MEMLSTALKNAGKKPLIFRTVFLGTLIALFVIFTFFDLQLSKALYGAENGFGKIFSYTFFIIGYVPAIFVDTVLFACCFWLVKKKPLRILFVFLVWVSLCGAIYTVFESFPDTPSAVKYGIVGGVGTLAVFPVIFGIGKLSRDNLSKLFYIFLLGAIMAMLAAAITGGFQFLWGRDRYFAILEGYGQYTPWYLPQGYQSGIGYRSFPSMHASSAASMVMLMLVAWKFELKKPIKIILYALAILIMVCVPISRIVMGWHYATDVIAGLLIAYGCAEIAYVVGDKIYLKQTLQPAGAKI